MSDSESILEPSSIPQPYDACFGVVSRGWLGDQAINETLVTLAKVVTTAMSSFKDSLGMKQVPVSIAAYGDMLKLSFQDSNKYAGLIASPVLSMLSKDQCTQLSATLTAPHGKQDQASKKTKSHNTYSQRECSVRIIVYGLASERVKVGNLLSDAGLYLQHPSPSEYDRHVEYINPHYLLRPGSRIPELEQLSTVSDSGAQTPSESLDEANKSRLMGIFDLADEVGVSLAVEPSRRLRSSLQEYESSTMINKCLVNILTRTAINSRL